MQNSDSLDTTEAGDLSEGNTGDLSKSPVGRKHVFWETQPVQQYQQDTQGQIEEEEEEGPITPARSVAEVRTEPYKLPQHYEWCTCDVNCTDTMDEIHNLLSNHYVEDFESMFRFSYSKSFLQWALRPPDYYPHWHVGVRVESSKRLVAFITGIPGNVRVRDATLRMAEINFLCIHKKLRAKRLAPLLIREVTRRVHLENVWQAVYTAGVVLPTPVATCHYWHRPLNPEKLISVGFSQLPLGMTMNQAIKHYRLPQKTSTPSLRSMERDDIPHVLQLIQHYLSQFAIAPSFSEADVEHWLLPIEDVITTFVVEDVHSHSITDVCSFYTLPSAILGNPSHLSIKAAFSFYNVTTKTSIFQLLSDALIVARDKDYDVFNVLDIMQNQTFVKELKFKPGDGNLHYYLYNYRLKHTLVPGELGLIFL